jgi:hypothetical protein
MTNHFSISTTNRRYWGLPEPAKPGGFWGIYHQAAKGGNAPRRTTARQNTKEAVLWIQYSKLRSLYCNYVVWARQPGKFNHEGAQRNTKDLYYEFGTLDYILGTGYSIFNTTDYRVYISTVCYRTDNREQEFLPPSRQRRQRTKANYGSPGHEGGYTTDSVL